MPPTRQSNDSGTYVEREQVIMQFGGQREVLFEQTETEDRGDTHDHSQGAYPSGQFIYGCVAAAYPGSDQSTTSTYTDPAAEVGVSWHMSGSYSIDRAGRLALSQQIEQTEYPYEIRGQYNILTGGDLPTLLLGTPPSDGYRYDIRLIR